MEVEATGFLRMRPLMVYRKILAGALKAAMATTQIKIPRAACSRRKTIMIRRSSAN